MRNPLGLAREPKNSRFGPISPEKHYRIRMLAQLFCWLNFGVVSGSDRFSGK